MFDIQNSTPFAVSLHFGQNTEAEDEATVIVNATYALPKKGGTTLDIAEAQVPVDVADTYHGDDINTSSLQFASALTPALDRTRVAVLGHAYAPRGKATEQYVLLEIGKIRKVVKVFGARVWSRTLGTWQLSSPLEYRRVPLTYENAYGGVDPYAEGKQPPFEAFNPAGRGFCSSGRKEYIEQLRLPHLEDPQRPLESPGKPAAVHSLGFIAPQWRPRRDFAGTYDDAWQKNRAPLLPKDFRPEFYDTVPRDQIAKPNLRGGERVRIVGCTVDQELVFELPRPEISVNLRIQGRTVEPSVQLDTVRFEPDERRAVLTYKATTTCTRKVLYIDRVQVRCRKA